MRLKTSHGFALKATFEALESMVEEIELVHEKGHISCICMDESHICLMNVEFSQIFEEIDWSTLDVEKLGIDVEDLVKILKPINEKNGLNMDLTISVKEDFLVIEFNNSTYTLKLIEVDEEKIPPTAELDVEFAQKCEIDSKAFIESMTQAAIYQDTLEIQLKNADYVSLHAEGEVGEFSQNILAPWYKAESNHARGVFSLAFLKNIMKIAKIAPQFQFSLADNAPAKLDVDLKYKIKIGKKIGWQSFGKATYYLAPMVEEGETYESDDSVPSVPAPKIAETTFAVYFWGELVKSFNVYNAALNEKLLQLERDPLSQCAIYELPNKDFVKLNECELDQTVAIPR